MAAYSIISWWWGASICKSNFSMYPQTPVERSCHDANFADESMPAYQPEKHFLNNIQQSCHMHMCLFVFEWMSLLNLSFLICQVFFHSRNAIGLLQKKSTKRSLDYVNIYLQTIETTSKIVLVIITFKFQLPVINITLDVLCFMLYFFQIYVTLDHK